MDICRTCLAEGLPMHPITSRGLLYKLIIISGIKIDLDNLPSNICFVCTKTIDGYLEFKDQIIKNERFLKDKLAKQQVHDAPHIENPQDFNYSSNENNAPHINNPQGFKYSFNEKCLNDTLGEVDCNNTFVKDELSIESSAFEISHEVHDVKMDVSYELDRGGCLDDNINSVDNSYLGFDSNSYSSQHDNGQLDNDAGIDDNTKVKENSKVICWVCEEPIHRATYKHHLETKHRTKIDAMDVFCTKCNFQVKNKEELQQHQKDCLPFSTNYCENIENDCIYENKIICETDPPSREKTNDKIICAKTIHRASYKRHLEMEHQNEVISTDQFEQTQEPNSYNLEFESVDETENSNVFNSSSFENSCSNTFENVDVQECVIKEEFYAESSGNEGFEQNDSFNKSTRSDNSNFSVNNIDNNSMNDSNNLIKTSLPVVKKKNNKATTCCPHCFEVVETTKFYDHASTHLSADEARETHRFCNKCTYKTKYINELITHKQKHKVNGKCICPVCGMQVHLSSYKRHMVTKHGTKKILAKMSCTNCLYKAKDSEVLKLHKFSCCQSTDGPGPQLIHPTSYNQDSELTHKANCSVNKEVFTNMTTAEDSTNLQGSYLKELNESNNYPRQEINSCDINEDNAAAKTIERKKKTTVYIHRLWCPYCYTIVEKGAYLLHVKKHLPPEEAKEEYLFCTKCKFKTKNSLDLLNHNQTHKINGKYICSVCGVHTYSYMRHMETVHTTIKVEKDETVCTTCNFKARNKSELKKHKKVHDEHAVCIICGEIVTHNNRHRHLAEHSGETEICKVCFKKITPSCVDCLFDASKVSNM